MPLSGLGLSQRLLCDLEEMILHIRLPHTYTKRARQSVIHAHLARFDTYGRGDRIKTRLKPPCVFHRSDHCRLNTVQSDG